MEGNTLINQQNEHWRNKVGIDAWTSSSPVSAQSEAGFKTCWGCLEPSWRIKVPKHTWGVQVYRVSMDSCSFSRDYSTHKVHETWWDALEDAKVCGQWCYKVIIWKVLVIGEILNSWKETNFTLIFKKGHKEDPGNFSSVGLTPLIWGLRSRSSRRYIREHDGDWEQYGSPKANHTWLWIPILIDIGNHLAEQGSEEPDLMSKLDLSLKLPLI